MGNKQFEKEMLAKGYRHKDIRSVWWRTESRVVRARNIRKGGCASPITSPLQDFAQVSAQDRWIDTLSDSQLKYWSTQRSCKDVWWKMRRVREEKKYGVSSGSAAAKVRELDLNVLIYWFKRGHVWPMGELWAREDVTEKTREEIEKRLRKAILTMDATEFWGAFIFMNARSEFLRHILGRMDSDSLEYALQCAVRIKSKSQTKILLADRRTRIEDIPAEDSEWSYIRRRRAFSNSSSA